MLKKIIDLIKSKEKTRNIDKTQSITEVPSSNISNPKISRFSFKQLIKNAYTYIFYLIRYKIGYVIPKKGRPQTVIFIARKSE